jgi:hypothetical protein
MLKELESRALKEDFALDGLISLASLFFVNTSLVDFPTKLLTSLLSGNQRRTLAERVRRKFLTLKLIKLVVLLSMIFYWRGLAMKVGFHGRIGGVVNYFFSFCEFFLSNKN